MTLIFAFCAAGLVCACVVEAQNSSWLLHSLSIMLHISQYCFVVATIHCPLSSNQC